MVTKSAIVDDSMRFASKNWHQTHDRQDSIVEWKASRAISNIYFLPSYSISNNNNAQTPFVSNRSNLHSSRREWLVKSKTSTGSFEVRNNPRSSAVGLTLFFWPIDWQRGRDHKHAHYATSRPHACVIFLATLRSYALLFGVRGSEASGEGSVVFFFSLSVPYYSS